MVGRLGEHRSTIATSKSPIEVSSSSAPVPSLGLLDLVAVGEQPRAPPAARWGAAIYDQAASVLVHSLTPTRVPMPGRRQRPPATRMTRFQGRRPRGILAARHEGPCGGRPERARLFHAAARSGTTGRTMISVTSKSRYAVVAWPSWPGRASGRSRSPRSPSAAAMPVQFLEQLFTTLRRDGLLQSQRGVKGGYTLARPPDQITVLEVVQSLDGRSAQEGKEAGGIWERASRRCATSSAAPRSPTSPAARPRRRARGCTTSSGYAQLARITHEIARWGPLETAGNWRSLAHDWRIAERTRKSCLSQAVASAFTRKQKRA